MEPIPHVDVGGILHDVLHNRLLSHYESKSRLCPNKEEKTIFISSTPLKGPPDKSQPRITSSSRQTIIFATGPLAKRWNVVSLFQCDLVNQTTFTSRRPTPLLPIHCLTKPSKDTRKPDKNLKFTTSVTYLGMCDITKFKITT